MWLPLLATALLVTSSQAPVTQTPPAPPEKAAPAAAAPVSAGSARDEKLPASESQAKAALDKTPRHGEYVDVKNPAGGPAIRTWVEYPERRDKAGVVLVHEIFGLSDWVRAVADREWQERHGRLLLGRGAELRLRGQPAGPRRCRRLLWHSA
jgi:hypothetical protein